MIGDAFMLNPQDTLAIGLIVLTVVQAAKLLGMPSAWSPVLAVALGGAIGVATGLSNQLPWESWLSLFYDGATGGLTGAGIYSVGSGMSNLSAQRKKDAATKARQAKRATGPPPKARPSPKLTTGP